MSILFRCKDWSTVVYSVSQKAATLKVRFEKQKVDKKKQTYMKTETCELYSRVI